MPYLVRAGGFQAALVEQHRVLSGGSGTRNRTQRAAPLSRLFHRITGGEIALLCRHGSPTTSIPTLPVLKIAELLPCIAAAFRITCLRA
jgi:hypothetical protein